MHLSLDIIAEEVRGLGVEVLACERRRGIVEMARIGGELHDNVLYVANPEELSGLVRAPRHLLVAGVASKGALPDAPNLAIAPEARDADDAFSRIAEAFVTLAHWDARMLEAIAARQGVASVLDIAAEHLSNPIALFDSKLALIARAGGVTDGARGTIWEDVLGKGFSPIEFFTRDEQMTIDRLSNQRWPYVLRPARDPGHSYLCTSIRVDRQFVGSTGQVDVNAPITPGQVALTDLVSDRLQMALALRLGNGPGEDDTTYLLRTILNGNKADKGLVSYHLKRAQWDEAAGFRIVLMRLPGGTEESLARENRLARIVTALPRVVAILYEEAVVALIPGDSDPCPPRLAVLLGRLEMRAVASERFAEMGDAQRAYQQCLLAFDATRGTTPPLVRFADAFEQVLPLALERGVEPRVLCDRRVLELVERGYKGDTERGRALVQELRTYLVCGCNAHRAARELFLHRNTLVYHVELLEQLLGTGLEELPAPRKTLLEVSCLVALAAQPPTS